MAEKIKPKNFRHLEGCFYGSALPTNPKFLDYLKNHGFGAVVSLEPIPFKERVPGIEYLLLPPVIHNEKHRRQFFRIFARNNTAGKKVLIHCNEGYGGPELVLDYLHHAMRYPAMQKPLMEEIRKVAKEKKRLMPSQKARSPALRRRTLSGKG